MLLHELKPFIPSGRDFTRPKSFFRDLGFKINWETEGLVELSLGTVAFLLQDFHNKEMQDNLMMYVTVENFDDWWQQVQVSGVLDRYDEVSRLLEQRNQRFSRGANVKSI